MKWDTGKRRHGPRTWRQSRRALARQRPAALSLEALEGRQLLATIPLTPLSDTSLSPAVRNAFERASNLELYRPAELESTVGWAARLQSGATSAQLAALLQIPTGQLAAPDFISDTYVFNRAVDGGPGTTVDVVNTLGQSSIVEYFYPLVGQSYSKRNVPSDPFFADQWHLFNYGQSGGTAGEDARLISLWETYTGRSVVVGVVDDGVEGAHPDLAANFRADLSFDFWDGDDDASPGSIFDAHGTSVAGVAAAVGDNGLGVSGAAPDAQIAGLRLVVGDVTDLQTANALSHMGEQIDIYNNSWGPADGFDWFEAPGPLTVAALEDGFLNGRGGLGNLYTWAAGNGLQFQDNVNYDGFANSIYTLAVTAVDHHGRQAFYAEPGASILVAAPSEPAGIVTTDLVGSAGANTVLGGQDGDDFPDLDYTGIFGGTSSATPLVSGVVALMLDANPSLTNRDIQHILLRTARQNDVGDPDWTTNGAGHLVNHKYGFGVIDAERAVAQALNWRRVAGLQTLDTGQVDASLDIPDADPTGISFTVTVPAVDADGNSLAAFAIEHVQIETNIAHEYRGDLEITLTSPSGTQSVLAERHLLDNGVDIPNWLFTSVRHWDESVVGDWTITVRDLAAEQTGQLQNVRLIFNGSEGSPVNPPVVPTTGSISGRVFEDVDQNGAPGGTEAGLAGRTVFIDANLNGFFDANEPFTTSGSNGLYVFTDLSPGQYRLGLACTDGFTQSAPATGFHAVTLGVGTLSFGNDFGDAPTGAPCQTPIEVVGTVFTDIDGNGVMDGGEQGVEGVMAYVDLNNNGVIGLGEPSAVTNSQGAFRIRGLTPGTYTVRMVPHPGRLVPTVPLTRQVTVLANGSIMEGLLSFPVESAFDVGGHGDAEHGVVPGFHLGNLVSGNAQVDDNDGVFFVSGLHPGQTEEVLIFAEQLAVSPGYLQAWIDFNGDGDWEDEGEQVFRNQRLDDGMNQLSFPVPASATAAVAFARFRWGFELDLGHSGPAFGGEVEDYIVTIPSEGETGVRAADDTFTVDEGSGVQLLDVLTNDTAGPLGGTIELLSAAGAAAGEVGSSAQGGVVEIVGDEIAYTPPADFAGTDSFSYTIIDSFGGVASANVTINVLFPVARDDAFSVAVDSVNNALDVLANDSDAPGATDDDAFQITSVTSPTSGGGTAVISTNGSLILYTPVAGFSGVDRFDYTVTDRFGETSTATVSVSVEDVTPLVRLRLAATDAAGNLLDEVSTGQSFQLRAYAEDLRDLPQGVFSAYMDVTYDATDLITVDSTISYGPDYPNAQAGTVAKGLLDEMGAADGDTPLGGGPFLLFWVDVTAVAPGTVNFLGNPADILPLHETTVFGLDDAVPSTRIEFVQASVAIVATGAINDSFSVIEDSQDNVLDVLANDVSPTGDEPLTLVSVGTPSAGGAAAVGDNVVLYSPAPDFFGTETFTYTMRDAAGASFTATVSVTVTNTNDGPTANPDTFEVVQNSVESVLDVLANDSSSPDPSETLLIVGVGSGTQGGTIAIAGDQRSILYSPPTDFIGTEMFSYTISDGNGGTAETTVTVNVVETATQKRAAFHFQVTDVAGVPVESLLVGSTFHVEVLVQDLTPAATGVFSAYLDMLYDAGLVRLEGAIDFNDDVYPSAQKGDTSVAGLIDEMGAVDGIAFLNTSDPVLLATLTFRADAAGTAVFTGDPADIVPPNETIIFGTDRIVLPEEMDFLADSVLITQTSDAQRYTNSFNTRDVNEDGLVTPLDALLIINDLNIHGPRSLEGNLRGGTPRTKIDVNMDGFASPMDALLVINELERLARADGESAPQAALSAQVGASDGLPEDALAARPLGVPLSVPLGVQAAFSSLDDDALPGSSTGREEWLEALALAALEDGRS